MTMPRIECAALAPGGRARMRPRDVAPPLPSPLPAVRRHSRPDAVLVGVCHPGEGKPVRMVGEADPVPERIDPRAFAISLAMVKRGARHVDLLTRHHGGQRIASTRDGTLRLSLDDMAGLVVDADLRGLGAELLQELRAGEVGLSVGFVPEAGGHRMVWTPDYRRRIRRVYNGELRHVALVRKSEGRGPVYSRAVARLAAGVDAAAVRVARAAAIRTALAAR